MKDHQPETPKKEVGTCQHKLEFINEWDIGNSWGGADYMYVFECVHCGEIFEDEGNDRSWFDYDDG